MEKGKEYYDKKLQKNDKDNERAVKKQTCSAVTSPPPILTGDMFRSAEAQ